MALNPAEQALLDANIKTKNCFTTIRTGAGFVNPVTSDITSLDSRAAALIVAAMAMPVTAPITALIANLTSLSMSLIALLSHTNVLSSVGPPGPGDSPYDFQARQGVLTGALHLLSIGVDITDTDTPAQKTSAFFGSILGDAASTFISLGNSFTALEALVATPVLFSAEAIIQNPIIVSLTADIDAFITTEDQAVDIEIERLHVYVLANTAIALTQNLDLSGLIAAIASPALQAALGI